MSRISACANVNDRLLDGNASDTSENGHDNIEKEEEEIGGGFLVFQYDG